ASGTPDGGPVAPPQTAFSDVMPLAAPGTISPETQSPSGVVPARPEPEQRPQSAPAVPSGPAQDKTPPPPHEQKSADIKTAYPPPAPPLPFRQKEGAPLQKPAAPATAQGLDTSSEIVRAESKISEHKLPLSPEEQKRIKRKAFEQLFSEHKADGQEITTPAQSQNTRKENDPYREPVE
ncbi:MAG: hypothetical protein HYU35_00405, partial [Parcubacteria group bacterium]|nr:hypothetical protein [Parcubacteria group bacterium]